MNNLKKSISVLFLCVIMLFSAISFNVNAEQTKSANLLFSTEENGMTVISVMLPPSDKLTAVDFSITLARATAETGKISTENTDISDIICDFDSFSEDTADTDSFTYTTAVKSDSINFSGFFLNSFSTEADLHLCDIIISANEEFTEEDLIEFSYTLTCEENIITGKHTYSLLTNALFHKVKKIAYPTGDANLDGKVDSSDARRILRASVGLESLSLEESPYADSDCDGKISAADARFALRFSVGLEEAVLRSFDFSLEDGKNCDEGGNYTFTCSLTEKSFTMEIANGGHIFRVPDCLNPGCCIICNMENSPASGHKFNENGICTACGTDKAVLDEAVARLISAIDEIHTYDNLATDSLSLNKRPDFIAYTQEATKSIRNATDICEDIPDLKKVQEHLNTAYSLRYQAFLSATDENGEILSTAGNCNIILSAVKESNQHIDYAAYLYE